MPKISIAEVLQSKMPRGAKFIPNFVVRYVARTVHEDEINYVLQEFWHLSPKEFIETLFSRWRITIEAQGLDRLPREGRYLFASNHPFGGMDGMMLADLLINYFGDARVVVNDLLNYITPLCPLWLPVNKHGRQNSEYAQRMKRAFESELPILTFPAGLCSRRRNGVIADTKWRTSFIKQARQSDRVIVPVFVEGRLSDRFYNVARFRERIGMKFNPEMIFLPDEMLRQSGSHFRILFGKPISNEELMRFDSDGERTEYVRERVYELAKKLK